MSTSVGSDAIEKRGPRPSCSRGFSRRISGRAVPSRSLQSTIHRPNRHVHCPLSIVHGPLADRSDRYRILKEALMSPLSGAHGGPANLTAANERRADPHGLLNRPRKAGQEPVSRTGRSVSIQEPKKGVHHRLRVRLAASDWRPVCVRAHKRRLDDATSEHLPSPPSERRVLPAIFFPPAPATALFRLGSAMQALFSDWLHVEVYSWRCIVASAGGLSCRLARNRPPPPRCRAARA